MHTQHSTVTPANTLPRVQELLTRLDQMKNDGLGARERLDFILDQGAELVQDFDLIDAFDLEQRAISKRLAQLSDMETSLRTFTAQWGCGPLSSDVQEAGTRLTDYLKGFVQDGQSKERKAEIDMLSQLWTWAPDVSHYWPHLDAWVPSRTYASPKRSRPEGASELAHRKEALYKAVQREAEEHPHHSPVPKPPVQESEKSTYEKNLEAQEEKLKSYVPKEKRKAFPIVGWDGAPQPPKVVAKVSDPPPKSVAVDVQEVTSDDPSSELRRDAWTAALRECCVVSFDFAKEMQGRTGVQGLPGTVMIWNAHGCEARLEMIESEEQTKVSLRVLVHGRLYSISESLSGDDLEKLHLDPTAFIERTLGASEKP